MKHSERTNRLPFIAISRRICCHCILTRKNSRSSICRTVGLYLTKSITTAVSSPVSWAISVPHATPNVPTGVYTARKKDAAIFTTLTTMSVIIGAMVFCIPINHPLSAISERVAGAAQTRMKKYRRAKSATTSEHGVNHSTTVTNTHCTK